MCLSLWALYPIYSLYLSHISFISIQNHLYQIFQRRQEKIIICYQNSSHASFIWRQECTEKSIFLSLKVSHSAESFHSLFCSDLLIIFVFWFLVFFLVKNLSVCQLFLLILTVSRSLSTGIHWLRWKKKSVNTMPRWRRWRLRWSKSSRWKSRRRSRNWRIQNSSWLVVTKSERR